MESFDPTAIPIDFDPREQRMRGIAYHGRTPFDVPYISHIVDNLWTGGCADDLQLPGHIKHVISLYPWEQYAVGHELDSYLAVKMYDTAEGEPDEDLVNRIADWVIECMQDGQTLVHCQAGLNRSALIATTALVRSGNFDVDWAINLLRDRRSPAVLCNPTFEAWLRR